MDQDDDQPSWDDEPEELSEEDAKRLFFDLLEDFSLNPFSTWDKIIADGDIVNDDRYTALPNMKSRKSAWDEWSKQKAHEAG